MRSQSLLWSIQRSLSVARLSGFRSTLLPRRCLASTTGASGSPSPRIVRIPPSHAPLQPSFRSRAPRIAAYAAVGVLTWTGILALAFNYQRQESSVVAGTFFALQHDPQVQKHLGSRVNWEHPFFPWIHGTVNYLKGIVDISFRIQGEQGAGWAHFSARRNRQYEWKTLEYTLETDQGLSIKLDETGLAPLMPAATSSAPSSPPSSSPLSTS